MRKRILVVVILFPVSVALWLVGWSLFHVASNPIPRKKLQAETNKIYNPDIVVAIDEQLLVAE